MVSLKQNSFTDLLLSHLLLLHQLDKYSDIQEEDGTGGVFQDALDENRILGDPLRHQQDALLEAMAT